MVDPIHTGGAKIPETVHEAAELAAEIRMQCIERKLAGAGFTAALADPDMEGLKPMNHTIEDLDRASRTMRGEIAENLRAIGEKNMTDKAADIAWRIRMVLDMTTALECLDEKIEVLKKVEGKK